MLEAVEDILQGSGLKLKSSAKDLITENASMKELAKRKDKHVDFIKNAVRGLASEMEKVNEAFLCPITREVMEDPVILMDGHTYERDAIERWLDSHNTSPKTNVQLTSRSIISNHTLKQQIESSSKVGQEVSNFLNNL